LIHLPAQPITFADFMERCLYDPHHGYYTSGRKIFGPGGDFYTSAQTHPLFAEILADAFAALLEQSVGLTGPCDLVEFGPGDGVLAQNILARLEQAHPSVAKVLRYTPVEVDGQPPDRISGIVFSNEFLDALPVHRVRVRGGELKEIYVLRDPASGQITEMEGGLSDERISAYMKTGFPRWHEEWDYEVNLHMVDWLHDLDRRIEKGFVVTIDYGFLKEEYDSVERAAGTIVSYSRHQVVVNPYLNPGKQDITAHVNFSVILETGREMGWSDRPLVTQREFMTSWGLEERLRQAEQRFRELNAEKVTELLHLKSLLIPGGISDVMKVLVQEVRTS